MKNRLWTAGCILIGVCHQEAPVGGLESVVEGIGGGATKMTVVWMRAEAGFATSGVEGLEFGNQDDEQLESYQQHSLWNEGGGFWN